VESKYKKAKNSADLLQFVSKNKAANNTFPESVPQRRGNKKTAME
jgi:hypothetical protein